MSLAKRYSPQEIEEKWYEYWMEKDYFKSVPDEREPFTIVIPPPNVTGVLHMGHMLNNTIQDIFIRKARLEGKNACWVPGTDHASIATEAKVVKKLREKGIKKGDLGREEFLEHAWEWKEQYGGIILEQLKKLGASCDWSRTRFTMEEKLSKAVLRVFVDLYRKGLVYKGLRMTNWDPEAKTVLSNEEVIYQEENSQFFYIRYKPEDGNGEGLVIATQRPETIMADSAVAVHPKDERFQDYIGKKVIIPLINKAIPVIADSYVDIEFGTGALKITPAHDQNDYEIGLRHNLEVVDILTEEGKLNEKAQILVGEDRFVARKKIKKLLEESGTLVKVEDYRTKIGHSERTDSVVEPRLTHQWFVNMREMARMALHAVESGDVKFYPENMWNMYYSWLKEENVRDWCISRQLWWGQRIPAWQYGEHTFVAETAEEALQQARDQLAKPELQIDDLRQDEDVLDTWFSSWLWPISVFDGFESQEELKYYYPTNVLVTGWDIMFFWVARMIMAGYEWSGELLGMDHVMKNGRFPFQDVYFTGMVRDNKRRKMSKSLGNSPDALELIARYGADGVRFGILSCSSAGNDIIFDAPFDEKTGAVQNESKLCEQGLNFCNKMWNALRLIKGWEIAEGPDARPVSQLAVKWFEEKLQAKLEELENSMHQYRLSEAVRSMYSFIWDDFCSWYLEMIKPDYEKPISRETLERTTGFFEQLMVLLHPFMPFVTEEIWHQLRERVEGEDCVIAAYPASGAGYDAGFIHLVDNARNVVSKIRELRSSKGVKNKEALKIFIQKSASSHSYFEEEGLKEMIAKLANVEDLQEVDDKVEGSVSFVADTDKFFLALNITIDVEAERARITEQLEHQKDFITSVMKKLGNEKFVNNAPPQVVERERKKLADGEARIKALEESLARLSE
jgi:valyl-tRNA synthetase